MKAWQTNPKDVCGEATSSTVTIAFKLADIKQESSEAYLLKLGKNLSWDFEVICIFGNRMLF